MKTIVSLSGGLDSTALVAYLKDKGRPASVAVNFQYGSKHNKYEADAASAVAKHYNLPLLFVDLCHVFTYIKSDLLLVGGPVPEGHYQEESMRKTVVPFRNGIFLSVLAAIAESNGATTIAIGAHEGDHYIYPDCRPTFLNAMAKAISHGTENHAVTIAPFQDCDKVAVARIGHRLAAPFHLTRTCYKDQPIACGKCGACQERLAAFAAIEVTDPIEYESREILPKPPEVVA